MFENIDFSSTDPKLKKVKISKAEKDPPRGVATSEPIENIKTTSVAAISPEPIENIKTTRVPVVTSMPVEDTKMGTSSTGTSSSFAGTKTPATPVATKAPDKVIG